MDHLDDVFEAQIEIAKAAAARWRERAEERHGVQVNLRDHGIAAVEPADRIARYGARATQVNILRVINPVLLPDEMRAERIIGLDDRRKRPESAQEVTAGRPVARIVKVFGDGIQPRGFGTGFMVSPDLLMTNNHVLPTLRSAQSVGANFGHDYVEGGGVRAGEVFELDTDGFFVTDKALDYTIVRIKARATSGADLADQSFHPLIQQTGKILIGKPVNIIQHPMGGAKQYATAGNKLIDLLDLYLHYQTDTEPGASGSPVFSEFWETVALHHSGVPAMRNGDILDFRGNVWDGRDPSEVEWVANEGVRISRILAHLKTVELRDAAQGALRDALLAAGNMTAPVEKEDQSCMPVIITTKESGQRPIVTTAQGSAQTIVHVHGDADVYTGSVVQGGSGGGARADAPKAQERLLDAGALEKVLQFDPNYGRRQGYVTRFLHGHEVGLPKVGQPRKAEVQLDRYDNPVVLDYYHFSLVMSRTWKLPIWSAVNIDYSPEVRWNLARKDFGSEKWVHDPRLSDALQIDNKELYAPAKKFDRGHVVRRDDNAWGATLEEVTYANSDTFHWTNCTPQHEAFNRSNMQGIWGKLENHIAEQAGAVGNRVILFGGPVLDISRMIEHDFGGGAFRVPLDFWKVVVVAEPRSRGNLTDLRAYGFLLEQEAAIIDKGLEALLPEEAFDVGQFAPQQRPLAELQERTGLLFPDNVLRGDVMAKAARDACVKLDKLSNVKLQP